MIVDRDLALASVCNGSQKYDAYPIDLLWFRPLTNGIQIGYNLGYKTTPKPFKPLYLNNLQFGPKLIAETQRVFAGKSENSPSWTRKSQNSWPG